MKAYDRPLNGSLATMVDLGTYELKKLNTEKLYPKNNLWVLTQNKYMS